MLRGISPDDVKLGLLAISAPAIITVICLVAKGKERWLFVFGLLLFLIIVVAVVKR